MTRFCRWLSISLLALLLAVGLVYAGQAERTSSGQRWPLCLEPAYQRAAELLEQAAKSEFMEMLSAIVRGSKMGPGDGWFRPGQGRYDWKWLASRHGKEADGSITAKEFTGPADFFRRLDRNGDGTLSASDFDWSPRSPFLQMTTPANMWFNTIDTSSNGRISLKEWEAWFHKLAKGRDYLTADDLRAGFPTMPPPKPKGDKLAGMPSMQTLLEGLLKGELGSPFEGPQVGQLAPDFLLPTQDASRKHSLSQYRGHKPVVLIFGSFT